MKKINVSKEFIYVLALVLDTFGSALLVRGNFGTSAMSSFPLILGDIIPSLSVGNISIIVQTIILIGTVIAIRKFNISYCFCFVTSLLYGWFLDLFLFIVKFFPVSLILRELYFVLGGIMVGTSIGMYMRCSLPLMPFDILVKTIADYKGIKEGRIKIIVDFSFLISTLLLGLLYFREIRYVGIATFILSFSLGAIADIYNNIFDKLFNYKFYIKIVERFAC